jgi:ribosomal protein S18 acetylase RimI-like enzyme
MATIRPALLEDGPALVRLDRATWSPAVSPGPPPPEDADFFAHRSPGDVLVADDGGPAGYVLLDRPTPLESNAHVLLVAGLAVSPAAQGRGVGRRLMAAAIEEAGRRGARRLRLRVLGSNPGAQALYASLGFVVEGVLRAEFLLAGRYVDDVLMARPLST